MWGTKVRRSTFDSHSEHFASNRNCCCLRSDLPSSLPSLFLTLALFDPLSLAPRASSEKTRASFLLRSYSSMQSLIHCISFPQSFPSLVDMWTSSHLSLPSTFTATPNLFVRKVRHCNDTDLTGHVTHPLYPTATSRHPITRVHHCHRPLLQEDSSSPGHYVRHASTRSQEHAGCTEFVCNHPSYVSSDNRPASRGAFRPRACYSLGRFGPSPLTTEGTQMPCVSLYPSFPSRRHMRWKPVSTRLTFLGGHKVWRDMTNAPSPPPLVCPFTCSSCCRCRRCHHFTAPAVYTLSSLIMYPY